MESSQSESMKSKSPQSGNPHVILNDGSRLRVETETKNPIRRRKSLSPRFLRKVKYLAHAESKEKDIPAANHLEVDGSKSPSFQQKSLHHAESEGEEMFASKQTKQTGDSSPKQSGNPLVQSSSLNGGSPLPVETESDNAIRRTKSRSPRLLRKGKYLDNAESQESETSLNQRRNAICVFGC